MKKFITEYVAYGFTQLGGERVSDVVEYLQKLLAEHGDTLVFDTEYSWGDNSSVINKERLETDEEYEKRLAKEKANAELRKQNELKQLAALKAKYGE